MSQDLNNLDGARISHYARKYYSDYKKLPGYFNHTGPGEYDINSTLGSFQHNYKFRNGPCINFAARRYSKTGSMDFKTFVMQSKKMDFVDPDSDKLTLKNPHTVHFGTSKR